jgi:hypothetical protein
MRRICTVLAAAVLAGQLASAQTVGRRAGRGPYDRLDPAMLSEALRDLGMGELLEQFIRDEMAGGRDANDPDVALALADSQILQAETLDSLDDRDRLLDQAVRTLETAIDALGVPDDEDLMLKRFDLELKLLDIVGRAAVKPYVNRVVFLMAADRDRRIIIEKTEDASRRLQRLSRAMRRAREDWNAVAEKAIIYLPELERREGELTPIRIESYLFRGMALHDANADERSEKRSLLNRALGELDRLIDRRGGVQATAWPRLLMARALRELGQADKAAGGAAQGGRFTEAAKVLKTVLDRATDPGVRYEALFEAARNRIEQGSYDAADEAITTFQTDARKLFTEGEGGDVQVDLATAMLRSYLHETRAAEAERSKQPEQAAVFRQKAQAALLDFLAEHPQPEYLNVLLDVVGQKYRDRPTEGLGALFVMGKARAKLTAASPTADDLAEAEKLLTDVVGMSGEIAERLRPMALWELGSLRYRMQKYSASAAALYRLAVEHPDHTLAYDAAKWATQINAWLVASDERERGSVHPDDRRTFIQALELLLGRWGDREETATWRYELGRQYAELARKGVASTPAERLEYLRKTAEAYEKVPADQPDYMQARFLALKARLDLLREGDTPKAEKAADARALAARLKGYAADAARAARAADEEEQRYLRDWGSRCAFERVVIRNAFLGESDEAVLADLEALIADASWKGTTILRDVEEYRIRLLFAEGHIAEGVDRLQQFLDDYPQEASAVLGMFVQRLRDRIRELQRHPEKADELRRYCQKYLQFAQRLKAVATEKDYKGKELYTTNQMLADALTLAGRYDEALKLWTWCAQKDQEQVRARARQVDESFRPLLDRLRKSGGNPTALQAVADSYLRRLAAEGFDANALQPARRVRYASRRLADEAIRHNLDERDRRVAALAETVELAIADLKKQLKRTEAADARNVRGLARTYRGLKDYPKALKRYRTLAFGLRAQDDPALYWAVQLEYCQTALAAFRDKPEQLRRLRTYILQLRDEDPGMGGDRTRAAFDSLRAEIRRRLS